MSSHTRPSLASPLRVQALGATSRPDLHTRYAACSSRTLFRLCLCKITRVRTWLCSCPSPTCSLTMRLARPPARASCPRLRAAWDPPQPPPPPPGSTTNSRSRKPTATPHVETCARPRLHLKSGPLFLPLPLETFAQTPAPSNLRPLLLAPWGMQRCSVSISVRGLPRGLYPLQGERQNRPSSAEFGEGSSAQPTPGYAKVSSGRGLE